MSERVQLPEMSDEFRLFLIEAAQSGYGAYDSQPERHSDGSSRLTYQNDNFVSEDIWRGGYPFSGQQTVSVYTGEGSDTRAIWQMNYRGNILSQSFTPEDMRKWYHRVLTDPDEAMPIRGQQLVRDARDEYSLKIKGTLADFIATERIRRYGVRGSLYVARFAGGLIGHKLGEEQGGPIWLAQPTEAPGE